MVRVTNDLLISADSDHLKSFILLDLSSAFDAVHHPALLKQLEHIAGVTDLVLTCLSNRELFFTVNCKQSTPVNVT